jgi:hypothetical protein
VQNPWLIIITLFIWVKKRRKSINERGHLTAGADTKNQRSIKGKGRGYI